MAVVFVNDSSIDQAAQILQRGGLVAFPTETVYGLGANALNKSAVEKIYKVKGRPPTNPLIVHIHDLSEISKLVAPLSKITSDRLNKLTHFWPGPLTIVLPASKDLSREITAGKDSVGIRIPNHPVALKLLKTAQIPIAAPSANVSQYVSATTAIHVEEGLRDQVDMILDGGACSIGVESTIISLLENPTLLRPGAITVKELEDALGESVHTQHSALSEKETALAPGMMQTHYSPKTRVAIRGELSVKKFPAKTALVAFREAENREFDYVTVRTISKSGDLREIAHSLYGALRDLDKLGLELIVIDTCSEVGIGSAIMDRIRRAASKN